MPVQNRIPLFLPENLICKTVNGLLSTIRRDYRDKVSEGREDESLLYLLLYDEQLGQINLYKEAVKIFITTSERPKHFDCKLDFDKNSTKTPQLFISQGAENASNNVLNIGSGDQEELIMPRDGEQDQYKEQFRRRYATTQYVMIVCENRTEMQIIYNIMKALIVASITHFELKGLSNLKLNGQELKMRGDIPDALFQKAIIMNFEYEQVTPAIVAQLVFRNLKLYWKMDGAEERQGPIAISVEDDLTESAS